MRSPSSGGSPRSPASTSTSQRGEIVLLRGPQRGRQDHAAAASCAGLLPVAARRGRGARLRPAPTDRRDRAPTGRAARPRQRPLRRPDRRRQRALLGPRPSAPPTPRSPRPWTRLGLAGRLAGVPVAPAVGRAAAAHRPGRAWSPAGPSCGCSTSPTPASTPPAATCSTPSCGEAVAAGATVRPRLPRARPGRAAGRPGRHHRRRPGRRRRRSSAEPPDAAGDRVADAGVSGRARRRQGPAHRGPQPGGHQPGRSRSPCSCWCCSPSPSTPTGAILDQAPPGPLLGGRPVLPVLLAVQRSFARRDRPTARRDALRLSGLDPAGDLPRQGGAPSPSQLLVLEVLLGVGRRRALRRPSVPTGERLSLLVVVTHPAGRYRRAGRRGTLYGVLAAGSGCARRCSRSSCSRWWRRC